MKRPHFQRRHFEAIAEIIRCAEGNKLDPVTIRYFRSELIDLFARDNSRFDDKRFLQACVPGGRL